VVRDGALDPLIGGGAIRTVVWCASRINPRLSETDPLFAIRDGADLLAFVRAASALPVPPRLILLSSGGTVYGPPAQPPFRESDEPSPVNAYGLDKWVQEQSARTGGLDVTVLRIANAYGPGQRPAPGQGVLAHWMTAVKQDLPVQVFGDPTATRDYVYADDVARAVVAAHRALDAPPVVNIGSGVATTLGGLLDALRLAVAPHSVQAEHFPPRASDASHSVLDVSLARRTLGWEPQVSLRDGVRLMWEEFPS
jgi:UDP-glucose 4-epimerase